MKKALQQYPFFILAVPIFYLLHLLNEYYHLLQFTDIFIKESWWYLGVSLLLFVFTINKKPIVKKTAIVFLYLQLIFFFFAATRDFFAGTITSLSHYQLLLPLIAVVLVLLIVYLARFNKSTTAIFLYLNSLFLILTGLEMANLVLLNSSNGRSRHIFSAKPLSSQYRDCDTCLKPDLYFIIFDGYAGRQSLQQYFGYDNSAIDSFFQAKGFYTPALSNSNYNVTSYSVGSILNMDYHKALNIQQLTTRDFMDGAATIADNELCRILSKAGYDIYNYSFFNMSYDKTRVSPFYIANKRELVVYQTFWDRFTSEMGWRFGIKAGAQDKKTEQAALQKENRLHLQRIGETYKGIATVSSAAQTKPVFVYGHFILPHDPYFYDSTGKLYPEKEWTAPRTDKEKYLSQLKYSNGLLQQLTEQLLADAKRPRVIVIQSDHGFRAYNNNTPKEAQFNNLTAIYYPDKNYKALPDTISSVNNFRFIVNRYFGMNVPLLKDTSNYIQVW